MIRTGVRIETMRANTRASYCYDAEPGRLGVGFFFFTAVSLSLFLYSKTVQRNFHKISTKFPVSVVPPQVLMIDSSSYVLCFEAYLSGSSTTAVLIVVDNSRARNCRF